MKKMMDEVVQEEMEYMEPLNTKRKPLKQLKVTVFKPKQLLQTTKGKPDEKYIDKESCMW